ncbi:hypothetical protein ABZP36_028644 [Zizania latifolia]
MTIRGSCVEEFGILITKTSPTDCVSLLLVGLLEREKGINVRFENALEVHNAAETYIELIGTSKLSPIIPFFSKADKFLDSVLRGVALDIPMMLMVLPQFIIPSGYELGWLYRNWGCNLEVFQFF